MKRENNNLSLLDRISFIANNEGISISAFERRIGASKGVLTKAIAKNTDIQAKWIQSIVANYPQYSPTWLLTGRGDIFTDGSCTLINNTAQSKERDAALSKSERLNALINHYSNGKKSDFANLLNVAPQTISTWITRDTYDIELIFSKCKDVSATWLISGEGGMHSKPKLSQIKEDPLIMLLHQLEDKDKIINSLHEDIRALMHKILIIQEEIRK